eukprot:gene14780-19552_t
MTLKARVIPCLDVKDGRVVKGVSFVKLPLDPARHFILCANVVGGCQGTTGPGSINAATGRPWGLTFPVITIADMVRAQAMLVEAMGIGTLQAVVGGSMGGMQVLQWASAYPESVFAAVPIATAARHSAQNIAFNEVGRQAIMQDPAWLDGDYPPNGGPRVGLAIARMMAHITYLSDASMERKFGRRTIQSRAQSSALRPPPPISTS